MERDYHNEDLDYFLKQKADQYKLYPSDKVWKGIYSRLHPGKRWFTIGGGGLLLLAGLLFVTHYFTSSGTSPKLTQEHTFLSDSRPGAIPSSGIEDDQSLSPQAAPVVKGKNQDFSLRQISRSGKRNQPEQKMQTPGADRVAILAEKDLTGKIQNEENGRFIPEPLSSTIVSADDFVEQSDDAPPPVISEPIVERELVASEVKPALLPAFAGTANINLQEDRAAIKLTPRKSRFNLQFYFSPTITYRRLADNKNQYHLTQQNIPLTGNSININRYVAHKPSFGIELGSNVLFNVSKSLVLKTGLQLNYSRYNIKAYKFYFEKASIALNSSGPVADTIRAFTSIRNFNGYSPEELQNQYLQVSLPVGAELKLLGSKRLQFSVAGSIQPNYLLFSDTYLLSTDYVNYAKEASLVRKWNVNTSLEAFISYNTGGLRWQVGPQFRYQLRSSYIDRYPFKEYLMEYGVKIGVSKTIR